MKTKIILAIIFLSLAVIGYAQPLPPTSPYGNPVPVGGTMAIVVALFVGLGCFSLRKHKK